jgi:hypothetical protein
MTAQRTRRHQHWAGVMRALVVPAVGAVVAGCNSDAERIDAPPDDAAASAVEDIVSSPDIDDTRTPPDIDGPTQRRGSRRLQAILPAIVDVRAGWLWESVWAVRR